MVGRLSAECMAAITFQGIKLQRPMIVLDHSTGAKIGQRQGKVLSHQGKSITIDEELPESKVHIRGYIWGQNTQIRFEELTGVQVRVKNVGIGSYNFALFDPVREEDRPRGNRAARAQSISGEIFIDYSTELERALRGDREGFQEGSRVYRELKDAVYKRITAVYSLVDRLEPRRNDRSSQDVTSGNGAQPPQPPRPTLVPNTNETPVAPPMVKPSDVEVSRSVRSSSDTADADKYNLQPTAAATLDEVTRAEDQNDVSVSSDSTVAASTTAPGPTSVESRRKRRYRFPFDDEPPFPAPELTKLTSAHVSEKEIIVDVHEAVLPKGMPIASVNQACVVAAVMCASDAAREAGRDWRELDIALALSLIAEGSADGN